MVIVVLVFMIVFLLRDVQVLALRDRTTLARFGVYTMLIVAAVAMIAESGDARPGIVYAWTERKFAIIAVLVQLAELAIAFALRRFAMGRYSWIGYVLPQPAFLVVLFALSFAIRNYFTGLDLSDALGIVTAVWIAVVGGCVLILNRMDNPWEDRKFANDFALMTSCTALIFVPFGLT
jgi:hypothetical protein